VDTPFPDFPLSLTEGAGEDVKGLGA
jgi:hypothetical protein